jgi:hypothetical protein
MITIYCQCGEKYLADEQHIGGRLQCKKCQRILSIEKSESSSTAQSVVQKDEHRPASQPKSQTVSASGNSPFNRINIILGMVVLALLVLILVLFNITKQSSPPRVPSVQKPTGGESYSMKHSVSPTAPTTNDTRPPRGHEFQNPKKASGSIASAKQEVEPENPNVLPLGTAPFGYDVRGGNSTLTLDNAIRGQVYFVSILH